MTKTRSKRKIRKGKQLSLTNPKMPADQLSTIKAFVTALVQKSIDPAHFI
jgi:hypothetical protein